MKKVLCLMVMMFLFTGCKVDYKITINNNLTVLEEVKMSGTDTFFERYYRSSRLNVIETMFNSNNRSQFLKNNGYTSEIVSDNDRPYVWAKKEYLSIEEFSKKTVFYSQYFENIDVSNNNGIITLKTNNFFPNNPDSIDRYDISEASITFKCNYEVISNNATIIDSDNGLYTWKIGLDTEKSSIDFSFDSNTLIKRDDNSINWNIIISIVVIMVLSIFFAIFSHRKQK